MNSPLCFQVQVSSLSQKAGQGAELQDSFTEAFGPGQHKGQGVRGMQPTREFERVRQAFEAVSRGKTEIQLRSVHQLLLKGILPQISQGKASPQGRLDLDVQKLRSTFPQ